MSNLNIYVMERGFIIVGRLAEQQKDSLFEVLDDCAVVRRWGTKEGLGQLAKQGPQEGTVLDTEPRFTRIRLTACDRVLPCNERAWDKWRPNK